MPQHSDWERVRLGDFAYVKARIGWRGLSAREYTSVGPYLIAGNHIVAGRVVWHACDHISERRYDESWEIALREDDVILTKDGTIGRIALIDHLPGPATINGTMMLVRVGGRLSSRYVFHYLTGENFRRLIAERVSGSSIPHLFQRDIVHFPVDAPSPEEQRRIAEVLDTADDAIRRTETLIAKLKQMKHGLLHDLLTRGLDENGELRDPIAHPEQFKNSPLGRIPRGWEVRTVGSLCSLLNGLAFRPEDWTDSGLPIIRIQNLNGGTEFNYFAGRVREEFIIPGGTLLFSWSGNRGTSFGPFVWHGPTGLLNQHIFRVTPSQNVCATWLFYALDEVRQNAERHAHGGSGLVHVRRGDLQAYEVATPSESEQGRIGNVLEAHDARIRTEEVYRDKLQLLKNGLIQDLLTGRVRVPVPAEEPQLVEAHA
jgi:type I restriction enzyme, S subunit